MNASNASHGVQRSQPTMAGRAIGKTVPRSLWTENMETNTTMTTLRPRPAETGLTDRFSLPNDSNEVKCAPKGVCKKWCMASFQARAQGKNGGFQMQFVKGRDGPLWRHPGTHQPPNHFGQIDSMDLRVIQNSIYALVATFIEHDAQQGGGIEHKLCFQERVASSSSRSTSARRSRISAPAKSWPAGIYLRISSRTLDRACDRDVT